MRGKERIIGISRDSMSPIEDDGFVRIILLVIIAGLLLLACQQARASVSIVDDTGTKVTLKNPAMRIISLYGGLTETICAMGLCSRLVGCTKRDRWPIEVRSKPKVGTHMRPNIELIIGLKPDLVIQGSSRAEALLTVRQLRARGIPVATFHPYTFEGLFSEIDRLGILCGDREAARTLENHIKKRLDRIKTMVRGNRFRPRVFFEVSYPSLIAAGQKNIVNDIIRLAGGENIVKVNKRLVKYSFERILADDPDIYIVQTGPMNKSGHGIYSRPNFRLIGAIRNKHVLMVKEFLYSRPGPRSVQAVEELATYISSIQRKPGTRIP